MCKTPFQLDRRLDKMNVQLYLKQPTFYGTSIKTYAVNKCTLTNRYDNVTLSPLVLP